MTLVKSTLGIKKESENNKESKSQRTEPNESIDMNIKSKNPSQNDANNHNNFPNKK